MTFGQRLIGMISIGMACAALAACSSGGGSSSSSSSSTLGLSGTLNVTSSSQKMSLHHVDYVTEQSVDLSQYKVVCSTTTAPVQTGTASVNADGSFSVQVADAVNQPLSCILVDASGNKLADFMIQNTAKTDMSGNSQVSTTAAYTGDASMGSINYDPDAGEVTVPQDHISSSLASSSSATSVFDPTGSWTIGSVDFTLPSGVKGPCASGGGDNCSGPPDGQNIYLKLWKGKYTADSSAVYGLQVWQGESSFNACGGKIGLTSSMKSTMGLDFSENTGGVDAPFSFDTSIASFHDNYTSSTGSVTISNSYQMSTAVTTYPINPSCMAHDIQIGSNLYSNAYICGPDSSSKYQVNIGGGCEDSSNKPVQVTDWSGLTCGSTTTDSDGVQSQSCTGTATVDSVSKSVTCTSKWAVATLSGSTYTVDSSGSFNWSDLSSAQIASGTACSAIGTGTAALQMATTQCYANYYDQSGMSQYNSACLPRVDTDWSAQNASDFVHVDFKPNNLVFFEQFNPFPDGSGGSILTRQEHFAGVQLSGNNWVNCRVVEVGGLSIKKISDTKLLAIYQSSTITTSLTKPACLAKFTGARDTFFFYLTK